MKSSHKENTVLYFIILQLSLDKLFKCDCVGRKKKHEKSEMKKITREEAIGGETQTGKTLSLTKDTLKTSQIAK